MRKRCVRRVWAKVDPIRHAIEGAAIVTDKQINSLRSRELSAIDAFAHGRAGLQEWTDVNAMLSVCEMMARSGIGPEAMEACEKAQDALIDAAQRFERTGKMGSTGPGIHAMRELYQYHDLQRTSISRSEYERMIQKAARMASSCKNVVEL